METGAGGFVLGIIYSDPRPHKEIRVYLPIRSLYPWQMCPIQLAILSDGQDHITLVKLNRRQNITFWGSLIIKERESKSLLGTKSCGNSRQ